METLRVAELMRASVVVRVAYQHPLEVAQLLRDLEKHSVTSRAIRLITMAQVAVAAVLPLPMQERVAMETLPVQPELF
jgi:hypothetical protein